MSSSVSMPGILLGGGTSGNPAGQNNIGALEVAYQNLLTNAADISGSGTKTLVLTADAIGEAGLVQIGNTETAAEVEANAEVLQEISTFCQANDITVDVLAVLTYGVTPGSGSNGLNALTNQWATAAAAANLPIASVTDVQEIGCSQPVASFSSYATTEVNAVQTLIQDYSSSSYNLNAGNLSVGDMEGGGASSVTSIGQWWAAYDQAAAAAGIPLFTSYTTDTGWFAPWLGPEAVPTWEANLISFASLAASFNMSVNVTIQGSATDVSANQSIQQAEQNAISLAKLQASGAVDVSNLTLQTWSSLPTDVGEISSPTSTANEAAEIAAVYPLYEAGLVTAQGDLTFGAPGQVLVNTGTIQSVAGLVVQWDEADVLAGARLGIVIIDQTGTLNAKQSGSGTVSNPTDNILILSGNSADLAAELDSVTLSECNAGPDTIDIETYGDAGRLSDNQISVFAAAPEQPVSTITASSSAQGWTTSAALINTGTVIINGSVMSSETLDWNPSGTLADTDTGDLNPPAFIDTVAIHEPLAEYGVEDEPISLGGTTETAVVDIYDPSIDDSVFPANGYANNTGVNNVISPQVTGWIGDAFNADAAFTPLTVESTTNTFNPVSGFLEQSVNALAPDPLSIVDATGTHPDAFATGFNNGGTQVVEYDTGDNPQWLWGDQFNSVTITYDGSGQKVEEFFQGGSIDPWFTIDDVFNPNNGQLWEVFQSTSPPPIAQGTTNYATTQNPYQPGFDTGPVYETQFEGSPNWDGQDWGWSISADTEVWTDYMVIGNFAGYCVNFPSQYDNAMGAYSFEFVNGSTLDLINLPGSMDVDLNALNTVTLDSQPIVSGLSGLSAIDAFGATGTVTLTGLATGGSTLIGGGNTSTINGFGHDTIVAGAGLTMIDTGEGESTISMAAGNASATLIGNDNFISALGGDTISITGMGETVDGSNIELDLAGDTSVTVNGLGDRINLNGTDVTLAISNGNSVSVRGTAADVAANLDALEALAVSGKLASINLTDGGIPVLPVSAAQAVRDAAALAFISGLYTFSMPESASPTDSASEATSGAPVPPNEVVLPGPASRYNIVDYNATLCLQDTAPGGSGTENLPGITELVFTNGIGILDPTGTAEDVARLYGAAFDRAPDVTGLENWTALIDNENVSLATVANDFTSSLEFIQDYGSLSDAGFVNQLYQNVLSRPADAAGAANWDAALAAGMSRGAVVLGFAESPEYEARTIFTAGDPNNANIYRLYETAFDRAPDPEGGAGWVLVLSTGTTITQVAQDFVQSAEFQQDYGTLSASDFVTALYQNALHRAPDATGLQNWINTLNGGASRASVIVGFADSLESRMLTAGATHANWIFIPT